MQLRAHYILPSLLTFYLRVELYVFIAPERHAGAHNFAFVPVSVALPTENRNSSDRWSMDAMWRWHHACNCSACASPAASVVVSSGACTPEAQLSWSQPSRRRRRGGGEHRPGGARRASRRTPPPPAPARAPCRAAAGRRGRRDPQCPCGLSYRAHPQPARDRLHPRIFFILFSSSDCFHCRVVTQPISHTFYKVFGARR